MKLGLKIILPILFLLLVILGSFGYLLYNLQQQEVKISADTLKIQKLNSLNERLIRQQEQTDYNVLSYRFNPDNSFLLAITQAELDKSKTLDEMHPYITSFRGRKLINSYIETRKNVESLRNGLIYAIDSGNQEQIHLSYNKWSIQTQNIIAALSDIKAYNINSLEKTLDTFKDIRNQITEIIILLGFVVIVTILFLYFYLRAVITTPLTKLAQFTDEVAKKNFTTTTSSSSSSINSKDEIGILARSFNTMTAKLKDYYGELEEKVKKRTEDLELEKNKANTLSQDLEKFKLAVDYASDHITITDLDGTIIYVNPAALRLTGFSTTEVLGKKAGSKELWGGLMSKEFYSKLWQTVKIAKQPFFGEIKNKRKNGEEFISQASIYPILNTHGEVTFFVEIHHDITKEKEIEKTKEAQLRHEIEIEAKEKDFISIASHQLLTPLALMKGYTSMLISGKLGKVDEEAKKYLVESLDGSERMSNLIKSLLTTSRIESGTIKIVGASFDLDEIAHSVATELNIKLKEKNLTIQLPPPKKLMVFADIDQAREVLKNVLDNAIKYTEKGTIIITESQTNSMGTVSISDSGIGINQKDLPHIFEKFYSSANWLQTQSESHGLGLYIAQLLLKLMGGTISVESKLKEGSTFTIALPLAPIKSGLTNNV